LEQKGASGLTHKKKMQSIAEEAVKVIRSAHHKAAMPFWRSFLGML
jgi:hypothetical protein